MATENETHILSAHRPTQQSVFSCCGRLVVEAHNMLAGHCTVCNYPDDPPGPIAVQKMLIERAEQEALASLELE